jgi:hypothetical protein
MARFTCYCGVCGEEFTAGAAHAGYCSELCRKLGREGQEQARKLLFTLTTKCAICRGSGTDCHHILMVSKGGKHNIENLDLVCNACHHDVHRFYWVYYKDGTIRADNSNIYKVYKRIVRVLRKARSTTPTGGTVGIRNITNIRKAA